MGLAYLGGPRRAGEGLAWDTLTDGLGPYVEWVPYCPEMGISSAHRARRCG